MCQAAPFTAPKNLTMGPPIIEAASELSRDHHSKWRRDAGKPVRPNQDYGQALIYPLRGGRREWKNAISLESSVTLPSSYWKLHLWKVQGSQAVEPVFRANGLCPLCACPYNNSWIKRLSGARERPSPYWLSPIMQKLSKGGGDSLIIIL